MSHLPIALPAWAWSRPLQDLTAPSRITLTWLDLAIIAVVAIAAVGGWHRGTAGDAASSLGHLTGGLVGFVIATSTVVPRIGSPVPAWVLLVVVTLGGALLGGGVGRRLAGGGRSHPGPLVAAAAGVLAAMASLGACWAAVQAVADLGPAGAAQARDRSAVITALDRTDPSASATLGDALRDTGTPTVRTVHLPDGARS